MLGESHDRASRDTDNQRGDKSMEINFRIPVWLSDLVKSSEHMRFPTVTDRMRFAVACARSNIDNQTGGPFGAAVFDANRGALIGAGVNLVESCGYSPLHAEIVAIMAAQHALGSYDLSGPGMPTCELVTSVEPCAMCLGAIPWSGVRSVVCGATDADARGIGFDEGAKPRAWVKALTERSIAVTRGVCRREAHDVLRDYAARGGTIY